MGKADTRIVAEKPLCRDDEELRELILDMQVGVVLQGPQAEMRMANPKALELLGLTEDQLLGRTSFDPMWNVVHEDGSPFPGPDHPVPRVLATGKPVLNTVMGVFRPVHGDRVWLSVDAVPQRAPSGEVRQVVCTFIDITERIAAEAQVRHLLEEKSVILKEVHHRIKNNMATVKALLVLQAERLQDPGVGVALRDAENRIQTMMVLYDKLYRTEDFGRLSVKTYLDSLVDEILDNFPNRDGVMVEKDLADVALEVKCLQPLGIIVNELLTNAMKYAFTGRNRGSIGVTVRCQEAQVTVTVRDDGVGLPESESLDAPTGFGLTLVDLMTKGLRGQVSVDRSAGTAVTVRFPVVSSGS